MIADYWYMVGRFGIWLNNDIYMYIYSKQENFKSQDTYYNYLVEECRNLIFWSAEMRKNLVNTVCSETSYLAKYDWLFWVG